MKYRNRTIAALALLALPLSAIQTRGQPVITKQPTDQSVSLGASVQFQVYATSATPPTLYQWRFGSTNLVGQTNSTLSVTNIQGINSGDYDAVLTDGAGSVTSQVAHLEVDASFTKIASDVIVNSVGKSGSCEWGDFDNDGFLDLFVTNLQDQKNFLFHNNRDGTFSKITTGVVVNDIKNWRGGAWADFDNDGNLDLIVVAVDDDTSNQTVLYRNIGGGVFTRMPDNTLGGLVSTGGGYSLEPAWADYDNDGLVDLFVARNGPTGGTDWLFHNEGNGVFRSITNNLLGSASEDSSYAGWADYNNDGRPDLLVVVNSEPPRKRLYLNLGGGIFSTITSGDIVTDSAHSVRCAWGDYDNDGNLDLFVANGFTASEDNALYHNNGDGTFTRMTSDVVGSLVGDGGTSISCAWGDYDNDGYLDLFVTNQGSGADDYAGNKNFLYRNNGDGSFTRVLTGSLANDVADSIGCGWADYDNDGFLDLFVANGAQTPQGQKSFLYHNNGNSNAWIKVRLIGTSSNHSAIGAKIRIQAMIHGKVLSQMREIASGSPGNQGPLEAHFGLADATSIDTLRIEWPSGFVQTMTNVGVKQILVITEPPPLTLSPKLMIVSRDNAVTVSWPNPSPAYALEFSKNLAPANWKQASTLLPIPVNNNGRLELTVPVWQSQAYFRLRKQ